MFPFFNILSDDIYRRVDGFKMIENNTEKSFSNVVKAQETLELARQSHEKFLVKGAKDDLEQAINYYVDVIKNAPNISEPYYRLATLLWQNGEINLDTAIEQCRSAVSLSPDNPNARIYSGYFLELAKKYDDAEKEFKEAIKISPFNSARPRISLAGLYLDKLQNTSASIKDVSQLFYYLVSGSAAMVFDKNTVKMICTNLNKAFSLASVKFFGNILEKTNNTDLAVKTYSKAAEEVGSADFFYQKIGDLNIESESPQLAYESYKKALSLNPLNRELLYKVATIAQTYFEGETDTAIDCYTKLLEIDDDKQKIYYELGHLYLSKKDVINAINAFKLALNYDDGNPFYHNALAYALVEVEQYDEAAIHYQKAIDINPNCEWTSIVCQALGMLKYRVYEDVDEALKLYHNAILLDSHSEDAYIGIGDIYEGTGDLDSAIKAYCDAITLNPKNPKSYNKCALALWQKDYLEEAIIAYNKAIGLDPNYAAAYNNLGVIYLDGIRNLKEAKKLFNEAISIDDKYAMAYFNLARVEQELGHNLEAAKNYQKALDYNPIKQEIDGEDILERLHSLFEV